MALRMTPEEYYGSRRRVQTQEPVRVTSAPLDPLIDIPLPQISNNGLFIIGIVAIVGLIGLFAVLGTKR